IIIWQSIIRIRNKELKINILLTILLKPILYQKVNAFSGRELIFFSNFCHNMVNFANFMRFLLAFLFICGLVSCKPGMNKILKSKDAAYKLKMAEAFYEQKKWGKAMTI